jgi:hypothetical protein
VNALLTAAYRSEIEALKQVIGEHEAVAERRALAEVAIDGRVTAIELRRRVGSEQAARVINAAKRLHAEFATRMHELVRPFTLAVVSLGTERETIQYRDDWFNLFQSLGSFGAVPVTASVQMWQPWHGDAVYTNKLTVVNKANSAYIQAVISGTLHDAAIEFAEIMSVSKSARPAEMLAGSTHADVYLVVGPRG